MKNADLAVPACYNGNVSQMCSNGRYATPFGFGFSYDGYDRLVGSQYAEGVGLQQNGDAYTEDYGYDANGNLQFLWRVCGGDYIDELYYDYYQGTNRIANIEDEATTAGGYNAHLHPYNYDYNGNPTYDPSRHATIAYSRLNKPLTVRFSPNDRIRYSYTSTGTKLRKEVEASATPQNLTTDYCGEFMYEDNELVCIFAPFGRMRPMKTDQGTQWRTYYSLTDHLGNVRAEFVAHDSGQPELVQQADYYPFGYTLRREDYGSQLPNRRLFGGKELQDETLAGNTLDWYDFEARMYDPLIGRFLTTDFKEEDYFDISPYAYCLNNPINAFDPDGKNPVLVFLIKGAVGAAADMSAQISISMINGKSFKEAMSEVDYTSVGASFVTSGLLAPGMSRAAKATTCIINGADALFDYSVENGFESVFNDKKSILEVSIDLAASMVPEMVVDKVSSGFCKAIDADLSSNAAATLTKESKAQLKQTQNTINSKEFKFGAKTMANFSGSLVSGQTKKALNSNDIESSSSRPPLILMPKEDKKEEQSIYQQIIFSKWEE